MKKKNLKPMIISALLAVGFGATSVGTSFALFTDHADTTINVTAGIVKIESTMKVSAAASLNPNEEGTAVDAGELGAHYVNGGSVGVDNTLSKVTVQGWTPGDQVTLLTVPVNSSNVKTKMRIKVVMSGELANALVVRGSQGTTEVLALTGERSGVSEWKEYAAEAAVDAYSINIAFPDHDNGKIVYGAENKDNAFMNKKADIFVYYEAVQANATTDDMLERINTVLNKEAVNEGANATMHDAMADLSAEQKSAVAIRGYVWNQANDTFYDFASAPTDANKYFKVYSEMPSTQDYSIYATGTGWSAVTLNGVGFDAGDVEGITSVTYGNSGSAKTNIIRTNSYDTSVTINAANDVVKHFGDAASVNIIAVAGSSYHEFGRVAFTEISTGRIVLEAGSETTQIHLNRQNSTSFAPITIANNGVADADLPEKITRDQILVTSQAEKELVVTVKDLVNNTNELVYAYPYSYEVEQTQVPAGTTEKTTVQNAAVKTALGMKVIDSNNHDGEKALAPQEKADVKQEVIETTITEDAKEASESNVIRIGAKYFTSMADAVTAAKSGDKIRVIRDCEAYGRDTTAYNLSGKTVSIFVDANVTLDCGNVSNDKFVICENNALSTLTFEGTGKLTFVTDGTWGLVTKKGSNSNTKVYVKDITIEASAADGKLMSSDSTSIEVQSGYFKNIKFAAGQIKEGYGAKLNEVTGYYEIVEKDPSEGAIFAVYPNNAPESKTYYTEGDIYKLTDVDYATGIPANSTLQLLQPYTFATNENTTMYLLWFHTGNITFDLCGNTLTMSSINVGYIFAGDDDLVNISIVNGTIEDVTGRSQVPLFHSWTLTASNFSTNATYSSNIKMPK